MRNLENQNSPQSEKQPKRRGRGRRAVGNAAVAAVLLVGGGAAANAIGDSLDTGTHSAEVKQDLQDTLKPTTEDLGRKLLDFAEAKKEDPNYTVSVFDTGEGETDTTISSYTSNGTFTSSKEFTVTVNMEGKITGISGSSEFQIEGSDPNQSSFGIDSPDHRHNDTGEWRGGGRNDGRPFNTGDQGLVGDHVGTYGDQRSDTDRAGATAELATDMVTSFIAE